MAILLEQDGQGSPPPGRPQLRAGACPRAPPRPEEGRAIASGPRGGDAGRPWPRDRRLRTPATDAQPFSGGAQPLLHSAHDRREIREDLPVEVGEAGIGTVEASCGCPARRRCPPTPRRGRGRGDGCPSSLPQAAGAGAIGRMRPARTAGPAPDHWSGRWRRSVDIPPTRRDAAPGNAARGCRRWYTGRPACRRSPTSWHYPPSRRPMIGAAQNVWTNVWETAATGRVSRSAPRRRMRLAERRGCGRAGSSTGRIAETLVHDRTPFGFRAMRRRASASWRQARDVCIVDLGRRRGRSRSRGRGLETGREASLNLVPPPLRTTVEPASGPVRAALLRKTQGYRRSVSVF